MGKDHRIFHRRAAQAATEVVTVNVEVVATVDADGNVLSQETIVQSVPALPTVAVDAAVSLPSLLSVPSNVAEVPPSAPSIVAEVLPSAPAVVAAALPSVPAVPTPTVVPVPSVPSVPPFPSDLLVPSVPPYPWPSGVPVAEAAASPNQALSTPVPTNAAGSSVALAPISAANPDINSTIPSTAALLSTSLLPSLNGISQSSAPFTSQSADLASTRGTTTSSLFGRTATASDAAVTSYAGGGDGPGNTAAPPASAATGSTADADSGSTPLETPQVVGSIVGSLAGAALILAIILLLIRRHKRRRGGALQLTGDDNTDIDQPMRQAPPSSSLVPSAFLHRFSSMSKSTADTSTSGERSFQRVSGRKLPSAFSEGMTSDQFSRGGTMSGSSFYQDDQGIYGGPGILKEFGKEIGDTSNPRSSGPMNFRPSPARTPIIRHPDDEPPFGTNRSYLSPPQSPNPDFPPRGTLGRSLPSADGSRSSRFTENV
ncbi:hypothetical protein BKA66DRAFT_418262 [Pyrenochaeta sp. MPI-SDFR-AT-0127]|nr:hypothetical protein BKA66DRAFT_418262 [Pyrenochaeta sp. MPI-SDFR-AT-0127]